MADTPPLIRQWLIIRALSARRHGVTVQQLALEYGVNPKTIRRDLTVFVQAGFHLHEQTGPHGRKTWTLDNTWREPGVGFTFDELAALHLGRRFLEPLVGTYFWEAGNRAYEKIRSALTPAARSYLEKLAASLHHTTFGTSDYRRQAELVDTLMQGIEDCRHTHLTYQSLRSTEPVTYAVYPYGIVHHRGSLYLIAHAPDHDSVRHYKIDRIEAAALDDLRFQRPADFDLSQHLASAFGIYSGQHTAPIEVQIRFTAQVARYVQEKRWHASQRLQAGPDGTLHATFRLSSTTEIKSWLLSFGAHAEVLKPQELRDEIRVELKQMLAAYRSHAETE